MQAIGDCLWQLRSQYRSMMQSKGVIRSAIWMPFASTLSLFVLVF